MPGEARAACLSDDTVALLLEGKLPEDSRSNVMSHVDACESCRRLVGDSADDSSGSQDSMPATRRAPIAAGEVIAEKYEVLRVVGEGGMGRVVEARHVDLGHKVALKIMHEDALGDSDSVSRFLREARIAAQLRSDHAVRIHDVGRLPSGVPYLVMELLVGEDLHALQKKRRLTVVEAVEFVLQAAQALVEAHGLGLIHRDVKPQNLFLAQMSGGRSRVKVVDFGLAKDLSPGKVTSMGSAVTTDHMILGSPNFMSPEQVRSPKGVDARTDIWALGATLFQLLTGRPPFEAFTVHGMLARILSDPVPSVRKFREEVPESVERAIARALEKDLHQRFQEMRAFAEALDEARLDLVETTTLMENAPGTERMDPRIDPRAAPTPRPIVLTPAAGAPTAFKETQRLVATNVGARGSIAPAEPISPAAMSSSRTSSIVILAAIGAIVVAGAIGVAIKVTQRPTAMPQPAPPSAPLASSLPPPSESASPSAAASASASPSSAHTAPAAPLVTTKPRTMPAPPSSSAQPTDPYAR